MINKTIYRNNGLTLLFFTALSIVLYFPTVSRSFVSDDFLVIRRVVKDHIFLAKDFFRPLSDISIFFNYLIGGFNPVGYYLFGILLHGLNSFLLFKFCQKWKWTPDQSLQNRYAIFAATLFLCYPFHNESIVWLLGRGSAMANAFGISSLILLLSALPEKLKIFWVCFCFFVGLSAYESILLLPLLIIVILYTNNTKWTLYKKWMLALFSILILHLTLRKILSGSFAGSYGESFFGFSPVHYVTNMLKVTGRFFLPPIQNSHVFSLSLLLLFLVLVAITISIWRKTGNKNYFLKIIILISISSIFPILFSVSTKTSESDRFLHFPSFFICCFISFSLVNLISNLKMLWVTVLLFYSGFIFFLEQNNMNWIRASDIVKNIINTLKDEKNHHNILVFNLPDEYKGAYIFRLGFIDALVINEMDSSQITIVNKLKREEMLLHEGLIIPEIQSDKVIIYPQITIRAGKGLPIIHKGKENSIDVCAGKENIIFYWNNQQLKKLSLPYSE